MTDARPPQELVERAVELSRADSCVVLVDETSAANLRWANNTLTTNGIIRGRQMTVVATVGGVTGTSAGVLSRSGVDADGVEALVRAAEEVARGAPPAEDAGPLVVPDEAPSASRWESPPAETSAAVFGAFAPSLGVAFEHARGQSRVLFGYAEHELRTTYLGSSTGLRLRHEQPTGYVELNAKSPDFARSAWAGSATADFTDIDVADLDEGLATRLGWADRRVELPAGRYETVLPPSAVADLMLCLYSAATARDAHDGRSVFSKTGGGTRVGERLTPATLTLRSDPAAPGFECSPFVISPASDESQSVFDNGLPLAPTAWIADGVLSALVQTRYSAQLTGLPVTPAIDNLIMEGPPDARAMADMVAATERGLLLTCLWYIRTVDPRTLLVTGLTRDGVYLVEGGEVVGAVNNFRFNESPVDLLARATEVGRTEQTLPREWSDYFTRAAMPALRVADFNMSSVSEAS